MLGVINVADSMGSGSPEEIPAAGLFVINHFGGQAKWEGHFQ